MMVTSPWLIDSEIISKFTVNAQAVNSWLECELVQAIVILAWIHSNAAFCYGIGINPEIDAKKGKSSTFSRLEPREFVLLMTVHFGLSPLKGLALTIYLQVVN